MVHHEAPHQPAAQAVLTASMLYHTVLRFHGLAISVYLIHFFSVSG